MPVFDEEEFQYCLGKIFRDLGIRSVAPVITVEEVEWAIQEFTKRRSGNDYRIPSIMFRYCELCSHCRISNEPEGVLNIEEYD